MLYLNGKFLDAKLAAIAHDDRGVLLSDGLFETLACYQGKVFALQKHWERFCGSALALNIPIPVSFSELENIISELIEINKFARSNAALRMTLTRGSGPRGLLPPEQVSPTFLVNIFALPDDFFSKAQPPISVVVSNYYRNEKSLLSSHKTLNYLEHIEAKRFAKQQGFDEALLKNSKEHIVCASSANIFCVKEDQLFTPSIECGALPGITRAIMMDLAKELNISVKEKPLTLQDLLSSNEIFLTNSLMGVCGVSQVNECEIPKRKKKQSLTLCLQQIYKSILIKL